MTSCKKSYYLTHTRSAVAMRHFPGSYPSCGDSVIQAALILWHLYFNMRLVGRFAVLEGGNTYRRSCETIFHVHNVQGEKRRIGNISDYQ